MADRSLCLYQRCRRHETLGTVSRSVDRRAVSALLLLGRLDPCPELKEPPQIVGVSPGLEYLPLGDPMYEGRRKRLRSATAGYPEEALLYAGVRRAHDHFVPFGDHVLGRPCLLDRAHRSKELADPLRTRGKLYRDIVHRPCRGGHLADLLDLVLADEV